MTVDIENYLIRESKCSTCPFRFNSEGKYFSVDLVYSIQVRSLSLGSQICHHYRLEEEDRI